MPARQPHLKKILIPRCGRLRDTPSAGTDDRGQEPHRATPVLLRDVVLDVDQNADLVGFVDLRECTVEQPPR
jgi:hypothetical protein